MSLLDTILDSLNQYHQRATYGAVAGLVGTIPRSVLSGRPKNWRHCWVVNEESLMPTGYSPLQIHASIAERSRVLTTAEDLKRWLTNPS